MVRLLVALLGVGACLFTACGRSTEPTTAAAPAGPSQPAAVVAPAAAIVEETDAAVTALPLPQQTALWAAPRIVDVATALPALTDILPVADATGDVFAGGPTVVARVAADGTTRWRTLIVSTPEFWVQTTGLVVVSDALAGVRAFRADTGAPAWSGGLAARPVAMVAAADAILILDANGLVSAWAAATGNPQWAVSVAAARTMAVVGADLVVAGVDALTAIEPSSGATRWTATRVAPAPAAQRSDPLRRSPTWVSGVDGIVYWSPGDATVGLYTAADGRHRKTFELGTDVVFRPVISGHLLTFVDDHGGLVAVDRDFGDRLWSLFGVQTEEGAADALSDAALAIGAQPFALDGLLTFATTDGALRAVDTRGRVVWAVNLPTPAVTVAPGWHALAAGDAVVWAVGGGDRLFRVGGRRRDYPDAPAPDATVGDVVPDAPPLTGSVFRNARIDPSPIRVAATDAEVTVTLDPAPVTIELVVDRTATYEFSLPAILETAVHVTLLDDADHSLDTNVPTVLVLDRFSYRLEAGRTYWLRIEPIDQSTIDRFSTTTIRTRRLTVTD